MRIRLLLFLLPMLVIFCPLGEAATYLIDSSHSNIEFKAKYLMLSSVRGRFHRFEGVIEFDPENISHSQVQAAIDAGSIDTRIIQRDRHLKSPDFFDVERFSKIVFVSKSVHGHKVTGELSMHGVTKPVILDFIFHGFSKDSQGKQQAIFSSETELNRKDFGIVYGKVTDRGGVVIGDRVKVMINVVAVLKS